MYTQADLCILWPICTHRPIHRHAYAYLGISVHIEECLVALGLKLALRIDVDIAFQNYEQSAQTGQHSCSGWGHRCIKPIAMADTGFALRLCRSPYV